MFGLFMIVSIVGLLIGWEISYLTHKALDLTTDEVKALRECTRKHNKITHK